MQAANGDIKFLLNCLAYPNGTAYNEGLAEVPLSSARIYTSIYVRLAGSQTKYITDVLTIVGTGTHGLQIGSTTFSLER